MTTPIDRLKQFVPPPLRPTYMEGNWVDVESQLGCSLPADYKEFIEAYGSGGFYPQELYVWNLFHSVPDHDRLLHELNVMEDADNGTPFSEFLKNTSVFLWGHDGFGTKFLWAQEGTVDDWYVIIAKGRLDYYRFPEFSFSEFLIEFLVERNPTITRLWAEFLSSPLHFKSI